jgi:hypothetical protein
MNNNKIYNFVGEDLQTFKENFLKETLQQYKGKKFFALMLFYETEYPFDNDEYELRGIRYFTDGRMALNAYANTPCPASQLIDAKDENELYENIKTMINNMNDKNWREINLDPYL